jgi:DNA replication licensing factor MCM6
MDTSSPAIPRSSLPPSSAPLPSMSISAHSSSPNKSSQASKPRRPTLDALALDDDNEADAEENQVDDLTGRRRRRTRGQANGDVPLVKDAVGESVAESFETFLKSCVSPLPSCSLYSIVTLIS